MTGDTPPLPFGGLPQRAVPAGEEVPETEAADAPETDGPEVHVPDTDAPETDAPELPLPGYAELCAMTNFTFLTGASHPEEMILRASELGLEAIAIADRNSVAGVVRAWTALRNLAGKIAATEAGAVEQAEAAGQVAGGAIPEGMETPGATGMAGKAGAAEQVGASITSEDRKELSATGTAGEAGIAAQIGGGTSEDTEEPAVTGMTGQAGIARQAGGGSSGGDEQLATAGTARQGETEKQVGWAATSGGKRNPAPTGAVGKAGRLEQAEGDATSGSAGRTAATGKVENSGAGAGQGLPIRSATTHDPSARRDSSGSGPLEVSAGLRLPRLIAGARLVLSDCPVEWVALPTDRPAWQRLSRLLTLGKRRAAKGGCDLRLADLLEGAQGMILIALPPAVDPSGGASLATASPAAGRFIADPPVSASSVPNPSAANPSVPNPSVPGRTLAGPPVADPSASDPSATTRSVPGRTLAGPPVAALASDPSVTTRSTPSRAPTDLPAADPLAGPAAPAPFADLSTVLAPVQRMRRRFPDHVFLGAAPRYDGSDQAWFDLCAGLALAASAPMVAVGDVLMHRAARRPLADVLTCMRHHIPIDRIGTRALMNAERRLKGAPDMARLYHRHPAALRRTLEIAARCSFDLGDLSGEYPAEVTDGEAAQDRLERLAREGLARRCPEGIPARYLGLLDKELQVVRELEYPAYFLTVHDIVVEARSRGILCQGRGSAANSIICWALGITDVSPEMIGMVFERFISRHRGEPPDIDVDFEHERREEVIQWIYEKYTRDRAGLCATVIHFRTRAAIREVGKVMGLSQDVIASLAGMVWGISDKGADRDQVAALGLDPAHPRLAQTIALIGEIIGFPRHLSQHVGGFVITRGRLDELCPIENAAMAERTCIEWDKDDIDALKILKVDVLSLGMLTCIRKAFADLKKHEGISHTLASVPADDAPTYAMLRRADAVGVFQVESRAQMNFLPRMKPREFYDLVIEVAIVRPGPIQGGMVKPYIRRRQGLEQAEPFGPALMAITRRTLGVPLFQEQALQIAQVGAGYGAEEADHLRRSLASFRRMGTIGEHKAKFIAGMLKNGYDLEVAQRCFGQIEGFADYGFPESHAAAFALLTYVSSWLKCHHPAIFAAALLNSQPMGFYAPAQILRDAREHGVELRPLCVNHSQWDNALERRADGRLALRLGFRQIRGFREADAKVIAECRGNGYADPEGLWLRTRLGPAVLERLAEADAFSGLGLTRRDALWAVRAIRAPAPLPLFSDPLDGEGIREAGVALPAMHLGEEVVEDYVATRLTLRAHPMELLRATIPGITPHAHLVQPDLVRSGARLAVCGVVITRQKPGTASGVVFVTLEDETGTANVVIWNRVFQRYRRAVMAGRLLRVHGRVEREGIVVHLIAERIEDLSHQLADLGHPLDHVIGITQPQADDFPRPPRYAPARHPRDQARHLFPSRDFH